MPHISPEMVQGYISRKKAEGRLSPKTINNTLVPLKEMFKHAVRWGYLRENLALYVGKPRVERREMDFLTPEEVRLMLEHARPCYRPLFLCAVLVSDTSLSIPSVISSPLCSFPKGQISSTSRVSLDTHRYKQRWIDMAISYRRLTKRRRNDLTRPFLVRPLANH